MSCHLSLINPFEPSQGVEWENVSTAVNPVTQQYQDPLLVAELRRFLQRDLGHLLLTVMYHTGCWFYGTFIIYTHGLGQLYYAFAFVYTVLILIDVIAHTRYENTRRVAHVRQWTQFTIAVFMAWTTSTSGFGNYQNCENMKIDLTVEMGFAAPKFSPFIAKNLCRDIINPFTFITPTFSYIIFRFPPTILAILYLVAFASEGPSRLVPHYPEESLVLFVKLVALIAASCVLFGVLVVRWRSSRRQLEQAIAVASQTKRAKQLEAELDTLLCATVPASALVRLSYGEEVADYVSEATVLFSDLVSFTAWSSTRDPHQVVSMLNALCVEFDAEAEARGIEKVKTIGDAYWAVCGLPDYTDDHAEKMCDFGNKMLDIVDRENRSHPQWDGIQIRIGINSGPLYGGILGTKQLSY